MNSVNDVWFRGSAKETSLRVCRLAFWDIRTMIYPATQQFEYQKQYDAQEDHGSSYSFPANMPPDEWLALKAKLDPKIQPLIDTHAADLRQNLRAPIEIL